MLATYPGRCPGLLHFALSGQETRGMINQPLREIAPPLIPPRLAGGSYTMPFRSRLCFIITGVNMPKDAHQGVVG